MGYTVGFMHKISSPITAIADGKRYEFATLDEFTTYEFDKRYVIECISAEDNRIIINLTEYKGYLRTDVFDNPDEATFF